MQSSWTGCCQKKIFKKRKREEKKGAGAATFGSPQQRRATTTIFASSRTPEGIVHQHQPYHTYYFRHNRRGELPLKPVDLEKRHLTNSNDLDASRKCNEGDPLYETVGSISTCFASSCIDDLQNGERYLDARLEAEIRKVPKESRNLG
uniref:Uncharacterized protein n=1 Tax=Vespula pensylvanica TaxID=30213 RepID=A0A834UGJ2_VESPE|nr:hypothetical protein H0235_000906 [Vespula pensylvanica]